MRRSLSAILGLLIVLTLAGATFAQSITLTYWTHTDRNREALEQRLIQEFMEANPGVTIIYDVTGSSDHNGRLLPAFAAGRGPSVASIPPQWISPLIENGAVAPLDAKAMGFESQQDVID